MSPHCWISCNVQANIHFDSNTKLLEISDDGSEDSADEKKASPTSADEERPSPPSAVTR